MIYFAGILESHLRLDGDVLTLGPAGHLFESATLVRSSVDPRVAILSRLANDAPGRLCMEALVREKIVFDPMLVSTTLPSYLVTEDRGGRKSVYSSATSQVTVQSQELLDSLRSNSDVDIIVISGSALYFQPLFSSILDAATFLEKKPCIVLDVASESYERSEDARLVRQIGQALEWADAIILEREDLHLFEGREPSSLASTVYLVDGGSVTLWKEGKESALAGGREAVFRDIISSAHPG